MQKGLVERMIDLHQVLSFVAEFGAENLIHDVAIVRQQDQTGRILVQPSDGENPLRMSDLSNNIPRNMRFARGRDADRLMIFDIEIRSAPRHHATLAGNDVIGRYLVAEFRRPAVDRDGARLNETVCLASGTDPMLCKELIDANGLRHGKTKRLDA